MGSGRLEDKIGVPLDRGNPLYVLMGDGASSDAFGRLRVSDPETLFDYQSQYDSGSLLWETSLTGSGGSAHNANKSAVDLSVTSASGDKVIRQTRQYHRYQPGKSQLVLSTFVMGAGQTNTRQRVGYFDANDGIFLELNGTTLSIVQRTSTSGTPSDASSVSQSNWNVDPFDGNGPSGIILDITKAQIFFIDLEWLGVGRVRTGFVINGRFFVAHEFYAANIVSSVYMKTANLPLRFEIENTGAASALTLQAICASVISEGGFEIGRGYQFSQSRGATPLSVTTEVAVISIRPKATFNSIVNRGQIILEGINSYVDTTGALFKLIYNPSLGGSPSWSSVDSDSIVEYDVAGTTITGGKLIDSWYVPAAVGAGVPGAASIRSLARLPLTLDISGANPLVLTLSAVRIGGTGTCNVLGSMTWRELR